MKYLIALILLISCTREPVLQVSAPKGKAPIICDLLQNYSTDKRKTYYRVQTTPRKPTPALPGAVLFLDFDGHFSEGSWETGELAPSGMSPTEIMGVVERVKEDYAAFQVTVTTDSLVYLAAPLNRRQRVVITESWEWLGKAGGVAYLGSFSWLDESPCFVFSSLLYYNVKNVGEAVSHELGHTLGLRHQAVLDGCTLVNEYNPGIGTGEESFAPIMGVGYSRNLTLWHSGTDPYCNFQKDLDILTASLPLKKDDYPAAGVKAPLVDPVSGPIKGVISYDGDKDAVRFEVSVPGGHRFLALPHPSAPNLKLEIRLYDHTKQLIGISQGQGILSAELAQVLPVGKYFLEIRTQPTPYATTYGMLGTYSVLTSRY